MEKKMLSTTTNTQKYVENKKKYTKEEKNVRKQKAPLLFKAYMAQSIEQKMYNATYVCGSW